MCLNLSFQVRDVKAKFSESVCSCMIPSFPCLHFVRFLHRQLRIEQQGTGWGGGGGWGRGGGCSSDDAFTLFEAAGAAPTSSQFPLCLNDPQVLLQRRPIMNAPWSRGRTSGYFRWLLSCCFVLPPQHAAGDGTLGILFGWICTSSRLYR